VHIPYETLQSLVTRLQQFQQASDLLRRTSRFVILARRLRVQMKEIQGQKGSDKSFMDEPVSTTIGHGKDIVDDKERAIAKAALSIAELGSSHFAYAELGVIQSSARLLSGLETPEEYSSKPPLDARNSIPLRSIKVFAHETFIEDARSIITNEMENMVLSGLATLVSMDVK
jgi:hypothetical protein